MRLERLALNGITRFTTPVTIDFTAIPAGSIVAVIGENGSGKSTILDSTVAPICLELPSRGNKTIIKYATGKDAYIDEVFAVGRTRYHARLSMDAVTGRTDGLIQREVEGKWVALNDGKISTFKAVVADRFPAPAVILASAFAAQNRAGSFLTMDRAKRKDLFSALLGLAHYEAMAEQCRAAALKLDRRRNELQVLLARLANDVTEDADSDLRELARVVADNLLTALKTKSALAAAKDVLTEASKASTAARLRAHEAVTERQALITLHGRVAADAARAEGELDIVAATLKDTLGRLETRRAADVQQIQRAWEAVPTDEAVQATRDVRVAVIADRCAQTVAAIQTRIDRYDDLLIQADAITQASNIFTTASRELMVLRARIGENAGATVEHELATAKTMAALIDEVPCGGKPPYDQCQLLTSAQAHKASLFTLEARARVVRDVEIQITEKVAELETYRALAERHAELLGAVVAVEELHAEKAQRNADAEADIKEVRDGLYDALLEVEIRRRELETNLTAIQQRADEDAAHARKVAAEKTTELTTSLVTLNETLASINADLDASTDTMTAYEAAVATDNIARSAVEEHHIAAAANAEDLVRLGFEQKNAEQLRALYDSRLAEQVQYMAELGPLEQDLVEYEVLAKCFGREGLPVLEIDAAGPAVSDLCNDLLQSCFGSSRFTVELVTQQPKADGKGQKEVFELRVFDSERGGEPRDLTDLSGGEQVIVDEALKSAIALFVSQQHESPIETCWRDETTGALDPQNAVRYVEMLRRLQQRGNFHHVLFITQNPDVAALADAQIHVDKATGQVTVRHAPFAEAA